MIDTSPATQHPVEVAPSRRSVVYRIGWYVFGVAVLLGTAFLAQTLLEEQPHQAVKQFTTVYSFVPEKISKSAPIRISVPEGVDEPTAQATITFSPEIPGTWAPEEDEQTIVFQPDEPLRSGVYYAVNMDAPGAQLSGDFYVDEDPEVRSVFPIAGSETHENSEITIVFNRPMVPLTTLTELESQSVPVTIEPETPGKFKWTSTRNLQFIPETTLFPATEYTVRLHDGLRSIDGLEVAPIEHQFTTRPLRLQSMSEGDISYRHPIVLTFNQPVDLEKTKRQISVQSDDTFIAIDVEYGEHTYYDREQKEDVTVVDESRLRVYQRKDQHGREHLWDFDSEYQVTLKGAEPLLGSIPLRNTTNEVVTVPDVIKQVTVESDRSYFAETTHVDPEGTVTVEFYEPIDIWLSNISGKGIADYVYAERCQTDADGVEVRVGSRCVTEDDPHKVIFSFEPSQLGRGESFDLTFTELITTDDLAVNGEPLVVPLRTYPEFSIWRTSTSLTDSWAEIDGMSVCSSVPLRAPGEDGLGEYMSTDGYAVYGRWSPSRYIREQRDYHYCNEGEFQTDLKYGLLPQTQYQFDLNLASVYDQTVGRQYDVTTEPPTSEYTRLHNMQQQYNVTTPGRTTLTYAAENLETIDLHLCRMTPERFLERTVDRYSWTSRPDNSECLEVITDTIELPPRYWVNNYFQIDLEQYRPDDRGHYILTLSSPLYRNRSGNQIYDRTYVNVTNLAVGRKELYQVENPYSQSSNPDHAQVLDETLAAERNLYWINHSTTLAPVNGAEVVQYTADGRDAEDVSRGARGVSDYTGVARVGTEPNIIGAVVTSGLDTAVVTDWTDSLQWTGSARDASRTYIYTDRPIYRPGHTVHIKGIDRLGYDGDYELWDGVDTKLVVYDSRGSEVYDTMVEFSSYGTFATDFELPVDASLGNYRVEVFDKSYRFAVEEYVPAAFKLEVTADKEEYIHGDEMKLDVQADYYFGVPLDGGSVTYTVTAQDYYFDRYTDEYFNFGRRWYYCYSCGYGDDFLFRGTAEVSETGGAVVGRSLDFTDFFDDPASEQSKLVTVTVTVQDTNGRSVSSQKSFILHKSDFYIGAKTSHYYTGENMPNTLRVKTVDITGEPTAVRSLDQVVYKVTWDTFKRQEVDGGFYWRSEKKLEEVSRNTISTDRSGNWSGDITLAQPGQYEVHVSKHSDTGLTVQSITNLYVYGSRAVPVPQNNNYELELEVEQPSVSVGDRASVLIKSPYERAKVLITAERGAIYDHWIVDVEGGLYLHEFDVRERYAPNVFVSALLLSGDPEVKHGQVRFDVDTDEHTLNVEVSSNKDYYLPGEEVTLDVTTTDGTGRPVAAEVSVAVADLSVLALKGNPKKNPLVFFYDGFPLSVTTAHNIKNILYEVDIPLGTKGGGGAAPADLATQKRGIFKDTAHWEAMVRTDSAGRATVSFTLPDNLTTWQIETLGVTMDTKLGVSYEEFTTKKDLMAVPLKPRFVVPGDEFMLGAKVFNQTDERARVAVSIDSDTLEFTDDTTDTVTIAANETATVYFPVVAPTTMTEGVHTFTFTAEAGAYVDSVEQAITITPNTTYETVATANFTKADVASEYVYLPESVIPGAGELTINANATMAVFMTDALDYMARYPYGCSEQLASALSTIGVLVSAYQVPNVEGEFPPIIYKGEEVSVEDAVAKGLAQIYENQHSEGGFRYYVNLRQNIELTMHVVTALHKLKRAGFEVREDVLRRATAYLERAVIAEYRKYPDSYRERVIAAEYTIRLVDEDVRETDLTPIVASLISDQAFLNEEISTPGLAYLTLLTSDHYGNRQSADVYAVLQNRIDFDGRGAYLQSNPANSRFYYETPIKNTALLLKIFAARDDEHESMGNVLRWLLASRDKHGAWGSTHNTFAVVDAMVDYLAWQPETEAHFTFSTQLDGAALFSHEFSPETVFETYTHTVPLAELPVGRLTPMVLSRERHNEVETNMYYDMSLRYFLPVAELPPRDEGITIERELFRLDDETETESVRNAEVGEVLKGKLTLTIPDVYTHVAVEDMIPAGFEVVNFNLSTEDQSLQGTDTYEPYSYYRAGSAYSNRGLPVQNRTLRPTHTESHDDRIFLYVERMMPGVYEYEYYIRAQTPGEFQHLPARAEELYFPEVFGCTTGDQFTVTLPQ